MGAITGNGSAISSNGKLRVWVLTYVRIWSFQVRTRTHWCVCVRMIQIVSVVLLLGCTESIERETRK